MDFHIFDLLLRWVHFFGGVIWMGHNYVNVVLRPQYVPIVVDESPAAIDAKLIGRSKREHAVFRYSSIVSWVTGMLMLWRYGWLADSLMLHGHYAVIGTAAWIGTIMMLNVWLVLWPHQKKVLGFVEAPLAERIRCSRITFLSARTNTVLSMPLLFFMAASQHGGFLFM